MYSGGKPTDGNYPLLSEAIKNGLFHPRCKDSTSTYYEGITTLKPVTSDEMAEMDRREKLEQQHSYYQIKLKRISELQITALMMKITGPISTEQIKARKRLMRLKRNLIELLQNQVKVI